MVADDDVVVFKVYGANLWDSRGMAWTQTDESRNVDDVFGLSQSKLRHKVLIAAFIVLVLRPVLSVVFGANNSRISASNNRLCDVWRLFDCYSQTTSWIWANFWEVVCEFQVRISDLTPLKRAQADTSYHLCKPCSQNYFWSDDYTRLQYTTIDNKITTTIQLSASTSQLSTEASDTWSRFYFLSKNKPFFLPFCS